MTPIEVAISLMGGLRNAAKLFDVAGYQALQSWVRVGRVPAEYCPRIEHLTGIRCEELNGRVDWSLIRSTASAPVDHAAELRAAILQTREVFAAESSAVDALNYLEAVLASTQAGGGGASTAEETLAGAGAVPVALENSAADRAAAAMAAESGQLVIQAEKSMAGAAARAAVDPLAVLSPEVFSLADKLLQPVDLLVQLMVLSELRSQKKSI